MQSFINHDALTKLLDERGSKNLKNLIFYYFDKDTIKALLYNCLRVDISDNNDKAEIVSMIIGNQFTEIGTGTNRISYFKNGLVIKVALDRRGLVDNFQEFKRSTELPHFLAKTYETNYLINICEYVEVMDQDRFMLNSSTIRQMLTELSKNYLFNDLGFTLKNSYNWGCRESIPDANEYYEDEELGDIYDVCILDYGYLYPIHRDNSELFKCPLCKNEIRWDSNFIMLKCDSSNCKFSCTPTHLRQRMSTTFEEAENRLASSLSAIQMPDLVSIEKIIQKEGVNL